MTPIAAYDVPIVRNRIAGIMVLALDSHIETQNLRYYMGAEVDEF